MHDLKPKRVRHRQRRPRYEARLCEGIGLLAIALRATKSTSWSAWTICPRTLRMIVYMWGGC